MRGTWQMACCLMTVAACASSKSAAPSDQGVAESAAEEATRYRVGDFVVYEYSGSALKAPVQLREEIVVQRGLQLEIMVTATRGDERRQWVQVVTDTPENRANNRIDKLFVLTEGKRRELPNKDNRDVFSLYEWIIPPKAGQLRDKQQTRSTLSVVDKTYEGLCTDGTQDIEGRPVKTSMCESEAFLWTKVSVLMSPAEGDPIYQMRVVDAGP